MWGSFLFRVLFCIALCFSSLATILMGKGELVALLCLSSWCRVAVIVLHLFLAVPCVGLHDVIVVFAQQLFLMLF